jgi:hypothetical protein
MIKNTEGRTYVYKKDYSKNNKYQFRYVRVDENSTEYLSEDNNLKTNSNKASINEVILKDQDLTIVSDDNNSQHHTQHDNKQNKKILQQKTIIPKKQKDIPLFSYVNLGITSLNSSYNGNENLSSNKKDGLLFGFGVGYNFDKNYFSTISFHKISMDDKNINDYIFSFNYKFNNIYLTPSVGILGGYSKMIWTKNPLVDTNPNILKSSKYLYGIEVNCEYHIKDRLSFLTTYQFLNYNHKTNINNSSLKYTNSNNILF